MENTTTTTTATRIRTNNNKNHTQKQTRGMNDKLKTIFIKRDFTIQNTGATHTLHRELQKKK